MLKESLGHMGIINANSPSVCYSIYSMLALGLFGLSGVDRESALLYTSINMK